MRKIYLGSCHCNSVRFEVDAHVDHVRICNCSICQKRGALIFRVPKNDMRLLTPINDLTVYEWGTKTGADYFCPECGILQFRKPSNPSKKELVQGMRPFTGWAVNARCLDGLNITDLNVHNINGADISIE